MDNIISNHGEKMIFCHTSTLFAFFLPIMRAESDRL